MRRPSEQRLEGLCDGDGTRSRIRIGQGGAGIERLEARFAGQAFAAHRHDSYAIGVTLAGVQCFRYRGARRHCLPGQAHVLHPDELHDGAAGTEAGFRYRIVYLDPALIQQALGGRALPFVADPIVAARVREADLPAALWRVDEPLDELAASDLVAAVADFLARTAPAAPRTLKLAALARVRALILEDPTVPHPVAALEALAGLDRWSLARQFRAAFGTSPSGFRTMRRLDRARRLIRAGLPLAEAALAAGFADQSHLTRQFKRSYGLTPAKWAAALA
jgi:AraC-like DNA-binding protein